MTQDNTVRSLEIQPVSIEDEMRRSYLDYAMSVIVSRAIPDACDGLKPVHRRILYAMNESGCDYNKPYRKSARIVGEVMGKYHPHGDSAIYQSLVRMAQDFSLRVPLIDGQGNFGSMDGDAAAAMRYTESRMAKVAHTLLEDIDKETVDFQDNYDGSEREPIVLPARFPNLLVNGAGGIAVGMATNIPPHNLGEIIDACLAYIDNNGITDEELMQIVPGPDFPTGGIILGRTGARSAVKSGRGSIIIRGRAEITDIAKGKQAIIVSEVPYQVNKALLVEKIGELVREKKIEGISELRDESDKQGVRIVIETKKDANADVILNQLYSFTQLQVSFGVNQLALDRGRPRLLNLKDVLIAFARFREEIITRRTTYLLGKSRDRAHILIGLSVAVANIDEVIKLIRNAPDASVAREQLLERAWPAANVRALIELVDDYNNVMETDGKCYLTDTQARAILDMKLARLTGLEQEKIDADLAELATKISDYLDILRSRERILNIMREELTAIKDEFATPRKTSIEDSEFESDIEDLIPVEDMVVTVTHGGYIKRVPLSTYRAQKRGGKGRSGMAMKDEDATVKVFVTTTHTPVLFFSTSGKVYTLKVYKLPLGAANSRGRALVNIFPLEKDETINVVMPMPQNEDDWDRLSIMFATNHGTVRRNDLSDFKRIQANGKIAMKLDAGDRLIGVKTCAENEHVLLSTVNGKCVRFPVTAVREFKSRASAGVRGIKLEEGNQVVSIDIIGGSELNDIEVRDKYLKIPSSVRSRLSSLMVEKESVTEESKQQELATQITELLGTIESELSPETIRTLARQEQFILTITENGYGKRSSAYEYRVTNRGGSGIVNIVTSPRNGKVAASYHVEDKDQIMLITNAGQLIRCPVHDIRITGRNTQGVTIFKTRSDENVVSVARIEMEDEKEEVAAVTDIQSEPDVE